MKPHPFLKRTALFVTLVYFSLTGLTMAGMERHALHHEDHHGNHAAQHASLICNWMCAASTYVHTSNQNRNNDFTPTPENLAPPVEGFIPHSPTFSFYIRPPPFLFS